VRERFDSEVLAALRSKPKYIPSKWLYAGDGAALFAEVTAQPEYYIAAAETCLLAEHSQDLTEGVGTLVDLGCCDRSRALVGNMTCYVAVDTNPRAIETARGAVSGLTTYGVQADLLDNFEVPGPGARLFALLGQTYGNFAEQSRCVLLRNVRSVMGDGDRLLIGVDLSEDGARIEAAYNDAAGASERFGLEILNSLGADPRGFDYVAKWDGRSRALRISLRAKHDEQVGGVVVAEGEAILIAESYRLSVAQLSAELKRAGLVLRRVESHTSGYALINAATL
jgi:L-histidine N-alpha-methyltransferase